MRNGDPPHFLHAALEFLNHVLLEQWTGRGGPPASPACPADLSPLDIYPWGHLESTVNATDFCGGQGLGDEHRMDQN